MLPAETFGGLPLTGGDSKGLNKSMMKQPKMQSSAFSEAEDDSARDLKIVECLAASHDSSGDSGHITESRFVVADLVAHIEAEGELPGEVVLQAAAEVSGENGLAAVRTRVHQIGVQLSGLIVIVERNFVPGSTDTRRHIRHPFPLECGKAIHIVCR